MWLAVKQPSTQHKKEFPYQALNPVTQESVVIENMQQIFSISLFIRLLNKQKFFLNNLLQFLFLSFFRFFHS